MKEIVVLSGKGGTGKTSITASLAVKFGSDAVVCDCDVDADDMHILLEPDYSGREDFYIGNEAYIDSSNCISCGKCIESCAFGAISVKKGKFEVNSVSCEGCGYCFEICPAGAVSLSPKHSGESYTSGIRTGTTMVHARLKPGSDNSGKLVAHAKKTARQIAERDSKQIIIVDGSPGIGCPVISSISGADLIVFVTEPTKSGLHDLKRVFELSRKFGIKSCLIINKADLNNSNTVEIRVFAEQSGLPLLAELPYSRVFTEMMLEGKTAAETSDDSIHKIICDIHKEIKVIIKENNK